MNLNWHAPTPTAKPAARYVAVRGVAQHKLGPFHIVHTPGMEHINGDDWEFFHVSVQDSKNVWGMFVEGLGWIDVMVPIEDVRDLTASERATFTNRKMVMVGSHTGKVSWSYELPDFRE